MTAGRLQHITRQLNKLPEKTRRLAVERTVTGHANIARRMRLWARDPHCAVCGCLVDYPTGFELDHKVPLQEGGPDTDENCQVLCVYMTTDMRKAGCHHEKTIKENTKIRGF